jgi:multiple antibiotic resistance protein
LNSLALMVGSYFIGAHVLNFFGVSLPVMQVGGGLIVASMGWSMLLEREDTHDTARKTVECSDALHRAFFPLTLPLTVGPGTISVAITLAALIAMAAVAITVLLCYALADQLARILGQTAMTVIVRLSSFLLICIGVQIMWNGGQCAAILTALLGLSVAIEEQGRSSKQGRRVYWQIAREYLQLSRSAPLKFRSFSWMLMAR